MLSESCILYLIGNCFNEKDEDGSHVENSADCAHRHVVETVEHDS